MPGARGRGRVGGNVRVLHPRVNEDPLVQLQQQAQVVLQDLHHPQGAGQARGGGGRLRAGLVPNRGRGGPARGRGGPARGRGGQVHHGQQHPGQQHQGDSSGDEDPRAEEIVVLKSLCQNLQAKEDYLQEKLQAAEDKFEERIEQTRREAKEKIEEENAILQYKLKKSLNSHLSQIELSRAKEDFKYKSAASAVGRITAVKTKIREALAEADRDFEDFDKTKTGQILSETLELLDEQEGLVRFADKSKFGFKIFDKLDQEEPDHLNKNPELLKKVRDAEMQLEKEDEAPKTKRASRRARAYSLSRSRTRSRSPEMWDLIV